MRNLVLTTSLLSLLLFITACAKKLIEPKVHESIMVERDEAFPEGWYGEWSGPLEVYNGKGLAQTVPMTLILGPTEEEGHHQWTIGYGQDSTVDLREYELITLDADLGKYLIDEKNTIKIEGYLLADKFISTFEVGDNVIKAVYQRDKSDLLFQIYVHKKKSVSITGDSVYEGDSIPPVTIFPVTGYQEARLTRKVGVE